MVWVKCIAYTAYDWLYTSILNNVHVEENGDFSALSQITHTGALLIGAYDNYAGGDPVGFLQNINDHMQTAKENRLIRSATWEALADEGGNMDEKLYTVYEELAAHGFFLSRFISPAYNHRTDEYGGTCANRGRIIVDILHNIKKKHPSLHVTLKINCNDFMQGGLTPEDSMIICRLCVDAKIDSIEVSGNGTSATNIHAGINEAYFKDFASQLADNVSIPVILVGGHCSIENMEEVLNKSKIEFLSLSRQMHLL